MEAEIVLSAHHLSKEYFVGKGEKMAALDDISFDLHRGEILGIIGSNGAGKSTLLKVLSRITAPSSGHIEYSGTLTSIIDIGTGFHPDLSGKENVFLSTGLLTASNKIDPIVYDKIVAFSGLADFMEMPIKQYSSGMYLRLAFSIAFHTSIDILLLDEVIAVGDHNFRKKCYHKIRELKKQGVGIILVSHSMETIMEFADRCILFSNGKILQQGTSYDTVEAYLNLSNTNASDEVRGVLQKVNTQKDISYYIDYTALTFDFATFSDFRITSSAPNSETLLIDHDIIIQIQSTLTASTDSLEVSYYITNLNNVRIFLDSYGLRTNYKVEPWEKGTYLIECTIPKNLLNIGVYTLGMIISKNHIPVYEVEKAASFKVYENSQGVLNRSFNCAVRPQLKWTINKNIL